MQKPLTCIDTVESDNFVTKIKYIGHYKGQHSQFNVRLPFSSASEELTVLSCSTTTLSLQNHGNTYHYKSSALSNTIVIQGAGCTLNTYAAT